MLPSWYSSKSPAFPNLILELSGRFTVFPIPTPPVIINEPVVDEVESVCVFILTTSLNWVSLLRVTGPSNSDKTVLDLPPSTTNLSLIVTSSNTTLNRPGSSPATDGIGVSNDVSSPVRADFFWFPM